MPAAIHGFKGFLGIGKQSTNVKLRDALVARDRFSQFYECDWQDNRNVERDPSSARATIEEVAIDNYDLQLVGVLGPSTEGVLSRMWYSLMGAKASAQQGATAAYLHTLSEADSVPNDGMLSAEKRFGTLAESEAANIVVKKMGIDFTQAGFLRHPFEAVAGKPERIQPATTATLPAVSTFLARKYAGHAQAFMTIAGVATAPVLSGRVDAMRAVDEDDFDVLSNYRRYAEYGALTAEFSVQLKFEDMSYLRRFWGGASLNTPADPDEPVYYATKIGFVKPTVIASTFRHSEIVDMPRAHLSKVSKPVRGKEGIVQTVEGFATYDSGTTKAFDVQVLNTQTTV